jgi:hypothetical protein
MRRIDRHRTTLSLRVAERLDRQESIRDIYDNSKNITVVKG